jgi:hypothetical protein
MIREPQIEKASVPTLPERRTTRFRIVKLEERIAPKGNGGGDNDHHGHHGKPGKGGFV